VIASDDMSTSFIFQPVDVGEILRPARLLFHLYQTRTDKSMRSYSKTAAESEVYSPLIENGDKLAEFFDER